MKWVPAALALVFSVPVLAQVDSRPPIVTAENDQWFRRGEPIVFFGEFYYPSGPVVFSTLRHHARALQHPVRAHWPRPDATLRTRARRRVSWYLG